MELVIILTCLKRGMMGDGAIEIRRIRAVVESLGYDRFIDIEIFSNRRWARPMNEALDTCIERFKKTV